MKHIVIGTAGHVDHGKTCLTRALTGVNTDRLKEEQKRGITIEIGFAQLTLPNGQTASIVDVPGHEKFIKNMLVGATGIDVVLLIVAADEGFMPQTQEHLEILTLLGVKNGIIVITKTDMVEEEWLEAIMEETREKVAGTFLENAPMIPVSAYTGAGIEELKQQVVTLVENTDSRQSDRPFRLPVDRVFSIEGFGAVVTGTLVDGTIKVGDEVMVYPQEKTVRVRELQNHDTHVSNVEAGMRVAINLSGIDRAELTRGCTIARSGSMLLTEQIAVHLTLTEDAPYGVRNSSQLHFYQGTQELLCKVRLLDGDELAPGESGYAQLLFSEPLTARNLDKFIVRFYSPVTTVGGGVILDMTPGARLKRNHPEVIARLKRLDASPEERILQMVSDAYCTLIREETLVKISGLSEGEVKSAVEQLTQRGEIYAIRGGLLSKTTEEQVWNKIYTLLEQYHREHPLESGIHLGELREKIFSSASKTADAVLARYCDEGKLRIAGTCAALQDFHPSFSPEQLALQEELNKMYKGFGFEAPLNAEIAAQYEGKKTLYQQVSTRMRQDGDLVALTPQVAVHSEFYRQALQTFVGMFADSDTVTIADFRTKLGVSRKYAQMYLDYFDSMKYSKMVGDSRVLLKRPDEA